MLYIRSCITITCATWMVFEWMKYVYRIVISKTKSESIGNAWLGLTVSATVVWMYKPTVGLGFTCNDIKLQYRLLLSTGVSVILPIQAHSHTLKLQCNLVLTLCFFTVNVWKLDRPQKNTHCARSRTIRISSRWIYLLLEFHLPLVNDKCVCECVFRV